MASYQHATQQTELEVPTNTRQAKPNAYYIRLFVDNMRRIAAEKALKSYDVKYTQMLNRIAAVLTELIQALTTMPQLDDKPPQDDAPLWHQVIGLTPNIFHHLAQIQARCALTNTTDWLLYALARITAVMPPDTVLTEVFEIVKNAMHEPDDIIDLKDGSVSTALEIYISRCIPYIDEVDWEALGLPNLEY